MSDLPADFQMAWSTARRAYAVTVDELTEENAQAYQNAMEALQIVASQYVPELRERRQFIEEMNKAACRRCQMMSAPTGVDV